MASTRAWPPTVSIVVAAHDEEACLPQLLVRLREVLDACVGTYEILVIDDGSSDRTFELVEAAAATDARVRGARLSRNEGHQAALLCGLARAQGEVVITIDADLQHPPERIADMLAAWREGADVVHMRRDDALPLQLRDLAARGFYVVFNLLSATPVRPGSTDFRLLDARCIAPLLAMPSSARFLRAAVRRIGFRQVELAFEVAPRHAGRSSYTIRRLLDLGLEALVATSGALVILPVVSIVVILAFVALLGVVAFAPGVTLGEGGLGWLVIAASVAVSSALALALASLGARAWLLARSQEPLYFVEREVGEGLLAHRKTRPRGDGGA